MYYLKYIFGIQLFLGSIWFFYYSIDWIGFLLIGLSSFILIPLIYNLLKKKMNGLEAGCLISFVFLIALSGFGISYLLSALKPVNTANSDVSAYVFEQNITGIVQPCFSAYDKAFSKLIKSQEEQCRLISYSQKVCNIAQQKIDKISISNISNSEKIRLLNEAKMDAKNSLQNWENFFNTYNNQCISQNASFNASDVKIQLFSAVKNKYLMELKIKKAKSS